jgi:methionine-rich copper-binding protein CopC
VTGKEVSVPLNGKLKPGIYEVNWNAGALSSGVYFYSIKSGADIQTRKMVLLK